MTEKKIQEIKELIDKAQVQIELFEAIQRQAKAPVHDNAIYALRCSIHYLKEYMEELTGEKFWTCCGGKKLAHNESCPVCGYKYEEIVHENQ